MKSPQWVGHSALVMACVVMCIPPAVGAASTRKRQIKSAIVEYRLTGREKGTEILYFDDYGEKAMRRRESVSTYGSESYPTSLMFLQIGRDNYMIDLRNQSATKSTEVDVNANIFKDIVRKSIPYATEEYLDKMAAQAFREPEVLGTETVLGRTCEVTKPAFDRVCAYQGMVLKVYSYLEKFNLTKEAIRLEENADIPAETFVLPEGLTIYEAPNSRDMLEGLFYDPGQRRE